MPHASGRARAWIGLAGWLAVSVTVGGRPTMAAIASRLASSQTPVANRTRGCLERFDPNVDYFPDKTTLEFAKNFTVEYHKSYKVVTVASTVEGGPADRYVLLQCGAPKPRLSGDLASAAVIPIPIVSMFADSTTHLSPLVYIWADDQSVGSVRIELETALARATNADYWINGGAWKSLAAMAAEEPRYRAFKAYRLGHVWLYDRRVNAGGGNDYWERGVSRPDLLLADLVKILHPDLVPDHPFQWYRPVPAE